MGKLQKGMHLWLSLPKPDGAEAQVEFTDCSQRSAKSKAILLHTAHFPFNPKSMTPFASALGGLTH